MRAWTGFFATLFCLAVIGCGHPARRLNAPPQGYSDYPHEDMQKLFAGHVDNAMLEDMAVADCHFVGHTAELNGSGARRVGRYAQLLAVYGGTLLLDTQLSDCELVEARLASLVDYLTAAGIEPDHINVEYGMPLGRGILATEAIKVRKKTELGQEQGDDLASMLGAMMGGGK